MNKYKLNRSFGKYEKGHIFESNKQGNIILADFDHYNENIADKELALMLHTGFLTEVNN